MKIHDLLRASSVKRWTTVSTIHDQSLAEHTFNVVMLCRHLCRELNVPDENLIKVALEHDLDEIHSGDIPRPFKQVTMLKHGLNLNGVRTEAKERQLSDVEWEILKAADMIDAIWFIKHNHHDPLGRQVYDDLMMLWDAKLMALPEDIRDASDLLLGMITYGVHEIL